MSSVKVQKPAPSFAPSRKHVANRIWQNRYIYMMVIPVLVYMILFKYMPMYFLRASFYDYKLLKGFEGSKYVGLKWFERLLSSPDLWQYIKNTLSLNLLSLAIVFPAPLVFAILLNEIHSAPYKKIVQTVSYLPHFISTVVLVSMINTICSPSLGVLAKIYKSMGMTPVNFMGNPDYFYAINIISGLWQGTGWNAVISISAITGIDRTQYEAASVDGATKWQQVIHVTLPHLKPMIVILLIMNVGKIFNADFGLFWSVPMNSAPLFPATQVVDTYVYRAYTSTRNVGMSTAAGFLQNLVGFICIMTANAVVRKLDEESSLF